MNLQTADRHSGAASASQGAAIKRFRVLFVLTVCLSAVAAAAQTIYFLRDYDESLYLYHYGATPYVFYGICAAVLALLFFSFLVIPSEEAPMTLAKPGRMINFTALLCGFFLAASILLYAIYALSGIETDMSTLHLAAILTALPASLYFFITAFSAQPSRKTLILFGFFVVIWAILFLLYIYFDMSIPLTSPMRPMNYLSLFMIMSYFLLELRFLLQAEKPRIYLSVSLMSIFALSFTCIPDFIMTCIGRRNSNSIFHIAQLCILFYVFSRMISVFSGRAAQAPAEYAPDVPKDDSLNDEDEQ